MVPDLFPRLADIGPLHNIEPTGNTYSAEHALENDDPEGEVVDANAVVLSAHNLGSHVAGRAACVLGVLRSPRPCDPEISYSEIAFLIKNYILWLYITMDDIFVVEKFKTLHHASDKEL